MARLSRSLLLMSTLAWTACAEAPEPGAPAGPKLAIDVAALNLVGVGDVVWDVEVQNGSGTPQVVWQRRISSSGYGDGAGSASYVGTCDAGANPNVVRVWVVGVYSAAVTSAGSFNSGLASGVGVVTGGGTAMPFQNPTTAAPLTRSVTCLENTDVAVQFDVALMRPAQQGFFDIAVNFNNIFCSAKFDCCEDDDGDGCESGEDIELLFTAGAGRGRTMVLGFACTAGTDASDATTLYLDPLSFDCTDPASGFAADFTVTAAAAAPGNQCTAGDMAGCAAVSDPAPAQADTYLFQVAVYRGEELLQSGAGSAHKVYWNVALGVTGAIGACELRTRATADNANDAFDGLVGGVVSAGAVYPYVRFEVPLGTCGSEPLTFDGTGPVQTRYTETTASAATPFAYGFAPGLPPAPVCASACQNGGTCTGPNTCTCAPGYSGPVCATNINECSPNPCQNGGSCTDGVNAFTCACQPGWEGATCAVNHDDCASNPCLNGGTCSDGVNSYTCTCTGAWTGSNCQTSTIGTSCLSLRNGGATTSGVYTIDPDGPGPNPTSSVWCDMSTDGGGYTYLKVQVGSAYNAVQAESHCAGLGMRLFIPRTQAHLTSAWQIATSASFGPSANADYLYIMGVYPKYNGATCTNTALTHTTCTTWRAGDDGRFWVSNRTNIAEPNGDNSTTSSMYYAFDGSGNVNAYNDISSPGYTSARFMCHVADKP